MRTKHKRQLEFKLRPNYVEQKPYKSNSWNLDSAAEIKNPTKEKQKNYNV